MTYSETGHNEMKKRSFRASSLLCISSIVYACRAATVQCRCPDSSGLRLATADLFLALSFVLCPRRAALPPTVSPPVVDGAQNVGDKHRLMKINVSSSCITAVDRRARSRPVDMASRP